MNLAAWVGLAELALSGCTTSTDHHYLHPAGAGDLLAAEIEAAVDLGMRFHPTYGSMSLSHKDGGLPPDDAVQDEDDILAESQRHVDRWHDPAPGAMVRIALAPCSPFTVSADLMRRTAELAERLDVRLHTHLAENAEDDEFALASFGMRPVDLYEDVGWMSDRSWAAHVVRPNRGEVAASASRSGNRPLSEFEHDPRLRHRPGCRPPGRRVPGRSRVRRVVVGRLRLAVAGGRPGDAPGQARLWCGGDVGP